MSCSARAAIYHQIVQQNTMFAVKKYGAALSFAGTANGAYGY